MIVSIEKTLGEDDHWHWIVREVRLADGGAPIRGAIEVDDRIVELWRRHLAWSPPPSEDVPAWSGTARLLRDAARSHRADDALWRRLWVRLHAAIAATELPDLEDPSIRLTLSE